VCGVWVCCACQRVDTRARVPKALLAHKERSLARASRALQEDFSSALEQLSLAEESFHVASPDVLGMVDNFGLLLLDVVWWVRLPGAAACACSSSRRSLLVRGVRSLGLLEALMFLH